MTVADGNIGTIRGASREPASPRTHTHSYRYRYLVLVLYKPPEFYSCTPNPCAKKRDKRDGSVGRARGEPWHAASALDKLLCCAIRARPVSLFAWLAASTLSSSFAAVMEYGMGWCCAAFALHLHAHLLVPQAIDTVGAPAPLFGFWMTEYLEDARCTLSTACDVNQYVYSIYSCTGPGNPEPRERKLSAPSSAHSALQPSARRRAGR